MRPPLKKFYQLLIILSLLISLVILVPYALSDQNESLDQTVSDTGASVHDVVSSTAPADVIQNITIELNSTNNLPVRHTTIEVRNNGMPDGEPLYLYTDENGLASFQGKQNETYNFSISANGYEYLTRNITILSNSGNKIRFELIPLIDRNAHDFWPLFIPAILGFVAFFVWQYKFYSYPKIKIPFIKNYLHELGHILNIIYIAILIGSWPFVIFLMLWLGDIDYVILPGIITPGILNFPVLITAMALMGVISYLLHSIGETFNQFIPKYKRKNIVWVYIRRIIIAPYIAIFGVYILLDAAKVQNVWFIYAFSFFAGIFTKTIEEWLYRSIQGLLPADLRKEIGERVNYNIENSELAVRLKVDLDTVYLLYLHGIKTVDQLASFDNADSLIKYLYINNNKKKVKKDSVQENNAKKAIDKENDTQNESKEYNVLPKYLEEIIKDAKNNKKEFVKLIDDLKLTTCEIDIMLNNRIYSINDFINVDISSLDGIKSITSTRKEALVKKQTELTGTQATGTQATGTPATGTPATGTPATGTPATGTPATGTPQPSPAIMVPQDTGKK